MAHVSGLVQAGLISRYIGGDSGAGWLGNHVCPLVVSARKSAVS